MLINRLALCTVVDTYLPVMRKETTCIHQETTGASTVTWLDLASAAGSPSSPAWLPGAGATAPDCCRLRFGRQLLAAQPLFQSHVLHLIRITPIMTDAPELTAHRASAHAIAAKVRTDATIDSLMSS
jgi:hypothetical protein